MRPRYNKPGKKHKEVKKEPRTGEELKKSIIEYISGLRKGLEQEYIRRKEARLGYADPSPVILTRDGIARRFKCSKNEAQEILSSWEADLQRDYRTKGKFYLRFKADEYKISDGPEEFKPYEPVFNFTECPICDTKLEVKEQPSYNPRFSSKTLKCSKGCFLQDVDSRREQVHIFEKGYVLGNDQTKHHNQLMKVDINKQIKHWKTNYRYIARLLDI